MNGAKPQLGTWRDEDVEAVLRDFFRAEMPADLRDLSAQPTVAACATTVNSTELDRGSRRTGRISLSVVAAALFVAFSLVLTTSPSNRNSRTELPEPSVAPVLNVARAPLNPTDESQLLDHSILNGDRNWHPAVIPPELRKFAPGLLIHSGNLRREAKPVWGYPDVEVPGFPVDDEEGKPKPPERSKAAKKN